MLQKIADKGEKILLTLQFYNLTRQMTICIIPFMGNKNESISISQFKAEALRLIAETASKGKEFIVTKRGEPLARVVPYQKPHGPRRGSLKGLIEINDDIVETNFADDWSALSE